MHTKTGATPHLSDLFVSRQPSSMRLAQIAFQDRQQPVDAVNVSIGNVSLPMHPAMQERMFALDSEQSPFKAGVVRYAPTIGEPETNQAIKHIIAASGFETEGLYSMITSGASQGMELVIMGTAGQLDGTNRPLLLIDAAYTNYTQLGQRYGVRTVSVQRRLQEDGTFSLPELDEIEAAIQQHNPSALVIIPYDNPTGQFYNQATIDHFARLAVQYDLWLISDEAYRELQYTGQPTSSVWGVTEAAVPGITGRRMSLESVSKVWNGCGLRLGALVTDNLELHRQAVAESTATLCANSIAQYVVGALAHLPTEELQVWFGQQRQYYQGLMSEFVAGMKQHVPEAIVSQPNAAIYSVVDLRRLVDENFQAKDWVLYCAREGVTQLAGQEYTLLSSPMAGFYSVPAGQPNPGRTQLRIAYVETPERMKLVPQLLAALLQQYQPR